MARTVGTANDSQFSHPAKKPNPNRYKSLINQGQNLRSTNRKYEGCHKTCLHLSNDNEVSNHRLVDYQNPNAILATTPSSFKKRFSASLRNNPIIHNKFSHRCRLISASNSSYSSTALNCGYCFRIASGAWKRIPTSAVINMEMSLNESPTEITL